VAHVVFLCTGNAARSVMAGAIMAAHLEDAELDSLMITTAGTHVIEGMPMSWRTREAIDAVGGVVVGHRSYQLRDIDTGHADLIVCAAREHVQYVRRTHPEAAGRTATLKRLARDLPATTGSLPERIGQLDLATVELEPWEDVHDPAGGDVEEFAACAREIQDLLLPLAPLLVDDEIERVDD